MPTGNCTVEVDAKDVETFMELLRPDVRTTHDLVVDPYTRAAAHVVRITFLPNEPKDNS